MSINLFKDIVVNGNKISIINSGWAQYIEHLCIKDDKYYIICLDTMMPEHVKWSLIECGKICKDDKEILVPFEIIEQKSHPEPHWFN